MTIQTKSNESTSVVLVGVGGQGILLSSAIIAQAAISVGFDVKTYEIHGMAQRGGSVTSHVRIGEASSPLIPKGKCDVLLAFEPAEAVRNLSYLKQGGLVIVNEVPVKPTTESLQETGYDGKEMIAYLRGKCRGEFGRPVQGVRKHKVFQRLPVGGGCRLGRTWNCACICGRTDQG